MRPARAPAQLDEAAHGPLTIKLLGPAQLPDLASGAPAGLHQVRVRGRVVPGHPEDPAAPFNLHSPTSCCACWPPEGSITAVGASWRCATTPRSLRPSAGSG